VDKLSEMKVDDWVEARWGKPSQHNGVIPELLQGAVGVIYSVGEAKVLVDFQEGYPTGRWMRPYEVRKIDVIDRLAKVVE
jgi:hypothetical protein